MTDLAIRPPVRPDDCPFCSGPATLFREPFNANTTYAEVRCKLCPARIRAATKESAVALWNRRSVVAVVKRDVEIALWLQDHVTGARDDFGISEKSGATLENVCAALLTRKGP